MEKFFFGYLPIIVGVAFTILNIGCLLSNRIWVGRWVQVILFILVVLATLGQILMVIEKTWPTYLFMIIILVCGCIQGFLIFIRKTTQKDTTSS